jgi:hypothetical protein
MGVEHFTADAELFRDKPDGSDATALAVATTTPQPPSSASFRMEEE